MMDWMINNKEWLFSGVGILALGALLKILKWGIQYFSQKNPQSLPVITQIEKSSSSEAVANESSISTPVPMDRISPITPNVIQASIESAPPLQQKAVAQRYIGQRIEWDTEFSGAKQQDNNLVRLQLRAVREPSAEYLFPFFAWCSVKLDDYPELAILPEKTHIRINGTITDVSVGSIGSVDLDRARLIFPSLKNVA